MKGGKTPIHRQAWYPADYHGDEHVRLLKARRDYRTLTFYRHFLDASFLAGGDLPADPEALAAVVEMPQEDVEAALSFCLGRLIFERGGRLYQKRVIRDVKEEFRYRSVQSELGRKGGKLAGRGRPKNPIGLPLIEDRATPSGSIGPPTPTPTPTPEPVGRKEPPAPLHPEQRAEDATKATIRSLQCKLGALLSRLAEHPNSRRMVPDWCREVTAYDKADGTRVKGVPDYRTVMSIDRLERSIADAEWHFGELEKREAVHGA